MTAGDALVSLLFGLVMNAILLRAATRVVRAVPGLASSTRATSATERFTAAVVVAASLVVVVVTLGGSLGILNRPLLMLLPVLAVAIAVELAFARRGPVAEDASRRWSPPERASGPGPKPWKTAAVSVAVVWALLFSERIGLPPVAWDALTYHMRYPVLWLQDGRLLTSAASLGEPSHTYFPLCGEMLLYWGMLTTGTDLWSSLSQVPFLLAGAFGVGALARRFGGSPGWVWVAALGWLATPGLLRQSVEAMVDVELAACWICSAFFLVRWRDRGERAWLYLGAASVGLLVGTKYMGILYALALAPLVVAAPSSAPALAPGGAPAGRRPLDWWALFTSLALILAIGGYSYVRNLFTYGNPILPLEWSIGGFTLLRGPLPPSHYFESMPRLSWGELLVSPRALLEVGPWFVPLLALPPLALWRASRAARAPIPDESRRDAGAVAAVAAVAIAGFLLAGFCLPYRDHRFFFPVVGLAWSLAPAALRRAPAWAGSPAVVASLLALQAPLAAFYWLKDVVAAGWDRAHWTSALLALAVGAATAWSGPARAGVSGLRRGLHRAPRTALRIAAGIALFAALAGITAAYEQSRFDSWQRYWSTRHLWGDIGRAREDWGEMAESWRAIADMTRGRAAVVAYAGTNIPYALGGYQLRNRVLFVPRNGNRDASFFAWGSSPPDPHTGPSRESWMENVLALGVEYLCVYRSQAEGPGRGAFPPEETWASEDPLRFRPVFAKPWARVYRVTPLEPGSIGQGSRG